MKFFNKTYLGMVVLLSISTPNAFATDTWLVSTDSNCKIHNPEPQPDESVTWSGDCVDGYAHGYGKMQWHIHSDLQGSYVGDYYQGKAHGKGKQTLADGSKYDGEYQNGKPHGKGTFITPFMIYDGEYYNGVMHGWGTMLVTENNLNTAYEGQWTNGNMNGVGRYIIPNNPDRHTNDENGYWQDDYLIIPALFKEKQIDKYLSKKQHAKLVQKLGKQVQRPKEILLPFYQYLTDPAFSKVQ